MTATTHTSSPPPTHRAGRTSSLTLRLAHAENALRALTSGQVDAIIDPGGKAYLMYSPPEHRRKDEGRLQAVIDSTADAITVVNRGGVVLSQSQAVSRVLGYEPNELVGNSIFELVHKDDVQRLYFAFFDVIEGFRECATAQFRHRARDGSWRMIEATAGKLRDASSTSAVFSFRPLWANSGNPVIETTWPKRELKSLRLESVDAHEVARSIMELCQCEIAAAQVEVLLDFRAEENIVWADWALLLEVMCSLLRNAVEFAAPGSIVTITSTNDVLGRLNFEFADQGVCTKSLPFPQVFESLRQSERSEQQLHNGLRSALNIARHLIEALGGTLLTTSGNGQGKGAAFLLTLNIAPLPDGVPHAPAPRA